MGGWSRTRIILQLVFWKMDGTKQHRRIPELCLHELARQTMVWWWLRWQKTCSVWAPHLTLFHKRWHHLIFTYSNISIFKHQLFLQIFRIIKNSCSLFLQISMSTYWFFFYDFHLHWNDERCKMQACKDLFYQIKWI